MEKIISKYKFEFFAVDTYKKYNVWPRKDVRFMSDSTVHKTELFNMSSQWEIPDGKVFTLDKKTKLCE